MLIDEYVYMKPDLEKRSRFMEVDFIRRSDPEQLLSSANHVARSTAPEFSREAHAGSTRPAGSDVFQLYLREIGQVKLLSRQEEIELANRIKRGDEQAREQMIKSNLRLVVKIAREYEGLGLPLLDLVNEGNIGLMNAVERFDSKRAKLSTYAAWWIKQSIKRALANQAKTIRLPVHVVDKLAQIRKTEMRLRELLEREPTDEELAEELGLTPRRIRRYREASQAPVSLDAQLDSGDCGSVSEIVADEGAAAPFDRVVRNNDRDLLYEAMATLGEREKEILAMRFGLDDGKPRTLENIGEHFGVSRERIRQIQDAALQVMRTRIERREHPAARL